MTTRKFKIHKEGYRIIIVVFLFLVALNAISWLLWPEPKGVHFAAVIASLLLFAFIVMFFRTPARNLEPDLRYTPRQRQDSGEGETLIKIFQ